MTRAYAVSVGGDRSKGGQNVVRSRRLNAEAWSNSLCKAGMTMEVEIYKQKGR